MIEKIRIKILPKKEVEDWMGELHRECPSPALGLLLAGDRWSCVNQVVVAKIENEIVGIATISEKGEASDGTPSIIALYVIKEYRGQKIGAKLLEFAIDYMVEQKLVPIHIDAMNSKILKMIEKLPRNKKRRLEVVDQSMGGIMDLMFDA